VIQSLCLLLLDITKLNILGNLITPPKQQWQDCKFNKFCHSVTVSATFTSSRNYKTSCFKKYYYTTPHQSNNGKITSNSKVRKLLKTIKHLWKVSKNPV